MADNDLDFDENKGKGALSAVPVSNVNCYVLPDGSFVNAEVWSSLDPESNVITVHSAKALSSDTVSVMVGADIKDEVSNLDTSGWIQAYCSTGGAANDPNLPITKNFYLTQPVDEPTNATASATGKGYVKKKVWTIAQLENEGNVGLADSGLHSLVTTDADGLPTINGKYAETNSTTLTANESSAYGDFETWEGYVYIPTRYPDTAAGKNVAKFELVDSYTGTTQADMDRLYIAHDNNGNYALERSLLKLKIDSPQAGSNPSYAFDISQAGRHARLFAAHTDKGGASQVDWDVRLTYEDGSVQTLAPGNFITNLDEPIYHYTSEQVKFSSVFTPDDGLTKWYDESGDEVDQPSLSKLQEVEAGVFPLSYTVYVDVAGKFSKINSTSGGVGPYQFSIDGGANWQASNSFDLSNIDIAEILPLVKDDNGYVSAQIGADSYVQYSPRSWAANIISGGAAGDTFYDDGAGEQGYNTVFSKELGVHLEESDRELTWLLDNATSDANYIYLNNGMTDTMASAEASLEPVLPATVSGQEYTVAYNVYDYYHGAASTESTLDVVISDEVTNAVLGSETYLFDGHTTVSKNDEKLSFVGTGNKVKVAFDLSNKLETTGDYWGVLNQVTLNADGFTKTGGTGWGTSIRSSTQRKVSDGVHVEFKVTGSGNHGMIGLNASGTANSYSDIDYSIYASSNTVMRVYENGSAKGSNVAYTVGDLLSIDIASDGTVEYKKNGTTFYTSANTADTTDSFWFDSNVYQTGAGISDYDFNGTDEIQLPDVTSQYMRIDNLRIFEGKYSDTSHFFKKVSNYMQARNINDVGVLYTDAHVVDFKGAIVPKFQITPYGSLQTDDSISLEYKKNNGTWTVMTEQKGTINVANEVHLSPFYFEQGIEVVPGDTLQYRVVVDMEDSTTNRGYNIYSIEDRTLAN